MKGYELEQDAENGDLIIRETFINPIINTNFNIDEFEKSLMVTSTDSRKIFLNADVMLEDICRIPSSMIPEDLKSVGSLIYSAEISDVFEPDIYDAVSLKTCVEKRLTIGAPGPEAMQQVISLCEEYLAK